MEKRTILFIVLSIIIWIVYAEFILPRFIKPKKPIPATEETNIPANEPTAPPVLPQETPPVTKSPPTEFAQPAVPLEHKAIETNLLKAVFTNQGAALESVTLKQYRDAAGNDSLRLLDMFHKNGCSLCLNLTSGADITRANWEIVAVRDSRSVKFRYTTEAGLVIIKEFILEESNYAFKLNILVENQSSEPINTSFIIDGINGLAPEIPDRRDLQAMRAYNDGKGKWYVKKEVDLAKSPLSLASAWYEPTGKVRRC